MEAGTAVVAAMVHTAVHVEVAMVAGMVVDGLAVWRVETTAVDEEATEVQVALAVVACTTPSLPQTAGSDPCTHSQLKTR